MRTVFFGTSEFAVPALSALHEAGHEIAAVITTPDRRAGRGRKMTASHGKQEALRINADVLQPEKLDKSFLEEFRALNADICVVASYGKIIPGQFLDIPEYGFINIHPSLLPKYRGPSPIQQPILNGDEETGVCIIEVTEEMDAGPILLVEKLKLTGSETAGELHDALAEIGASLIVEAMEQKKNGTAVYTEQDHEAVIFCTKIEKNDGLIIWDKTADEIQRHVRAMTPWPGAFTFIQNSGRRLKVSEVKAVRTDTVAQPGQVIQVSGKFGVIISCGEGAVQLMHLAPEGSRRMTSEEFARGNALEKGDRLVTSV